MMQTETIEALPRPVTTPSWKRLSSEQVRIQNELHSGKIRFSASLMGRKVSFLFPARLPSWFSASGCLSFALPHSNASMHLELMELPLTQWVTGMFGDIRLDDLPEPLRKSIVDQACGELSKELGATFPGGVWSHNMSLRGTLIKSPGVLLPGLCTVADSATSIPCRIVASREHAQPVLDLLASKRRRAPVDDRQFVPFNVHVTTGSSKLSVRELARMEPGDVILISTQCHRLCCGEMTICTLRNHKTQSFVVEEILNAREPAHKTAKKLVDVEQIDVTLQFDIGSRRMTLAELRALSPGSIIELPTSAEGEVRIRINNTEAGTGHIVQIDNHLGCRVTEVFGRALPSVTENTENDGEIAAVDDEL